MSFWHCKREICPKSKWIFMGPIAPITTVYILGTDMTYGVDEVMMSPAFGFKRVL